MNSWKAFSESCWLWKCFPCKMLSRCSKSWQSVGERSGEYGRWDKTSKPNSLNFWSTGCVACGLALSWTGPFLTNDQCGLQALQFSLYLVDLLSILVRNHYWFHQDSESCRGSDGQQTTKEWSWSYCVCVQVWLLEVLWSFLLVQPLSWSGCPIKSTFICMAQLERKTVHCCCIE